MSVIGALWRMLIMMPLLLLVIFGYAANFYVSSLKTAVVGPQAAQVAATLPPLLQRHDDPAIGHPGRRGDVAAGQ